MDVPLPAARPGGAVGQTRIRRKVPDDLSQNARKQLPITLRIEMPGRVGAQAKHQVTRAAILDAVVDRADAIRAGASVS
jgi:hypothetical protein